MAGSREEFIQGLRDMADLFEKYPEIPLPWNETFNVFVDKEELTTVARCGTWNKEYNDTWFMLTKKFGPDLKLEINIGRDAVCQRVVVGQRVIPARPAMEERTEDIVEWKCEEPILGE